MTTFFPPNNKIKSKRKGRVATQILEREPIPFEEFTDEELYNAKGGCLVFDIESYFNYFLIAFRCFNTNRVAYFEIGFEDNFNRHKLLWIIHNFCLVGFNSKSFDEPLLWLSMQPETTPELLKYATNHLIKDNMRPSDLEKMYGFKMGRINHIDLIEVAPLRGSLKAYGSRLHSPRLQDLPYDPETSLTPKEMIKVRNYCVNDLDVTMLLLKELSPQLTLRYQLSLEYGIDLRSKSDAQIAEAVISSEVKSLNGYWAKRPEIAPGMSYKYNVPDYLQFQTPALQKALEIIRAANFVVAENGSIIEPAEFEQLKQVKVGNSEYRMGIGGLHSNEECVSHIADEETLLGDFDVSSYYPNIIINQGLYPKHLTENFLEVYKTIVTRRLFAKKAKNKVVADSLKIVCNGSFGKFGSKYSALYSPDLMLQVTISGQITLLLLIETLELNGIPVVSGNTDGIVIKCPKNRYNDLVTHIKYWESVTGFEMEETRYKAMYSRDINNYICVKEDDSCKAKGAYAKPGLQKNPTNIICVEAVKNLIVGNIPVEETITNCKDISKFVTCRNVKGGAEKDGVYLGRIVRWIYGKGCAGTINYVINGNTVPKSEGALPLMDIPNEFPEINYDWYIQEADSILYDIGYYKKEKQITLF